jgi:hypothetical protein
LSKEQPRAQTRQGLTKNTTKSSIEVVARVVELLEQNMTSLTTLSWCLSVTQCSSLNTAWDISRGVHDTTHTYTLSLSLFFAHL